MNNPIDWNAIIVDDEPDNLGVIALVLDFHRARRRSAASAAECLRLMEIEAPNLLLIDIQMPAMDGIELLERIRENVLWRNIPAIAVTARAMPEDRAIIEAAGFDGYITKPIAAMTFVDEVRAILNAKSAV